MAEATKTVQNILCKRLKVSSIDANDDLRSLGLDSLDVVEILLQIEDELGVQFSSEELKKLKKVGDLYDAIETKLKK